MTIYLHEGDLPDAPDFPADIAVDTEAMGLRVEHDALCLVQISAGDGDVHLVRMKRPEYACPRLKAVLADPGRTKIFHYARFDMAAIQHWLGVECRNIYCTKIASRLARSYSGRHGLRDLTREIVGEEITKAPQCSDWGAADLSEAQVEYAAADVLYLHRIRAALDDMLRREGRFELASACFACLPARVALDLNGWNGVDIFAHS